MGLRGLIDDKKVLAGNLEIMQVNDVVIDVECKLRHKDWLLRGSTVVFVAIDNEVRGCQETDLFI